MAKKFGVPVCPHAGGVGLCELVQHLSIFDYVAVSGTLENRVTEFVDHLHEHFVDPCVVEDGAYVLPGAPGYSAEMHRSSLAEYAFPDGGYWSRARSSTCGRAGHDRTVKLMRYGAAGSERPVARARGRALGHLAADGGHRRRVLRQRRMAAVEAALAAGALDRFDPRVAAGSAPRSPGPARSSASGSTTATTPLETGAAMPAGAGPVPQGPATIVGPYDPRASSRAARRRPTGRSSSASSSGRPRATCRRRPRRPGSSPDTSISHDVSEREFQLERGGQWDKGKSCETFNPLGPWLVHARRGRRSAGPRPAPLGERRARAGRLDGATWSSGSATSSGTSASSWCCGPVT